MPGFEGYTLASALSDDDLFLTLDDPAGSKTTKRAPASLLRAFTLAGLLVNVKDPTYGAKGDGTTDDRAAINSAIQAASSAGGGIVFMPPGTYSLTLAAHPGNANYYTGVIARANVWLLGAGMGATILKLAASQQASNGTISASCMLNFTLGGGDQNMVFADFTVDGNNANQGSGIQAGISMMRTRSVRFDRVRVTNCRGTGASGYQEAFHFETQLGTDSFYTACEVVGSADSTGTGFSANQATNVRYVNCTVRGMSVAHGFTHNTCGNVQYVGCHSYANSGASSYGFNSEVSQDVIYDSCIAGGSASAGTSYPYTTSQSLGNGNSGFCINGTNRALLLSCISSKNATHGVNIAAGTTNCRIVGGVYSDNVWGIATQAGTSGAVRISGNPVVTNNSTNNFAVTSGTSHAGEGTVLTPAVPSSTVAFTNTYLLDAVVTVTGGAVSAISVNGNATGATAGVFLVRNGGTITLTYTSAPTWSWTLGLSGGGGIGTGTITSAHVLDGTLVDADINASAAIALSKLATNPLARANHTGTQLAATVSDFDTQVRTSRLDQMAAPTGAVAFGAQRLTSVADPTGAQDAATKNYVDANMLTALVPSSAQTGSYTLVLGDAGKAVTMTVASANNLTVPPNSSVAFSIGTVIGIEQLGAGTTTVVPGAGVTINSRGGLLSLAGQYASASLRKIATDTWVLAGDLV